MDWLTKILGKGEGKKRIFLDYASATPVLPEVRETMEKYWTEKFYNPNAIYEEGVEVSLKVDKFRREIAKIFGVAPEGVIFTSGGTEANTWAVQGVGPGKIIVEEGSHPSVEEAVKDMKSSTWQVDDLLVLDSQTTLVSSVTTDNKLGRQIREERKKNNSQYPLLHIDASQSAQYYNCALDTLACDLLTVDSAKLYGPKGIGALIVKRGVKLNLRPQGTPPVPLIAGFAKALEIAVRDRDAERIRLTSLSGVFAKSIQTALPQALVTQLQPNIVNIAVPGILPEFLVLALDRGGVLVSTGPACNSYKPELPETPVRFSFGKFTTLLEVEKASEIFCHIAQNLLKSIRQA